MTGADGPLNYFIVGSWDDWVAHPMVWDSIERSYAYDVLVGDSGQESFRILLDGDLNTCIYPDCVHASRLDDHEIMGPDAGGLQECWTIGYHQEDRVAPGSRYKVRAYIKPSSSKPKCVIWAPAEVGKSYKASTRIRPSSQSTERAVSSGLKLRGVSPRLQSAERLGSVERDEADGTGAKKNRAASRASRASSRASRASSRASRGSSKGSRRASREPGEDPRVQFTGNTEVDRRHWRVTTNKAIHEGRLATERAMQTDVEGCFEVISERVAVRSGPATWAPATAVAKLGNVVRGTPFSVKHEASGQSQQQLWLRLDGQAMHRLGATHYADDSDRYEYGWMLMDGSYFGYGLLLRRTTKPEMPDEVGVWTKEQAKQKWQSMGVVKKDGPDDPAGAAADDAKGKFRPGKTNCTVCGFRAIHSREKLAHDRETGHNGFWLCPT